jgi:molybdopterin synthase catalytic subunit
VTAVIRLQPEPIAVDELLEAVRGDGDGAVALFVGTVRDHNAGERVRFLEYEAYDGMARAEMARIAADAVATFEISRVAIAHRTGRLEIGEASVVVAVASAHRAAAMDACRSVIDTLKRTVPIWKREHFEGGAVWIEGAGRTATRVDDDA